MSKFQKGDTGNSALQAVEDALRIDFKGGRAKSPVASVAKVAKKVRRMAIGTGAPTARQNIAAEETADAGRQGTDRKQQERARGGRRAANDDVRSVGNLLYALQRRPSFTPFWAALGLTV